ITGGIAPPKDSAQPQMSSPQSQLPLRDRIVIWGCLGVITLLAWVYLVRMANVSGAPMAEMEMAMPMAHRWTPADLWLMFVMWAVMMVAMMLPGASPMLTMYARVARGRGLAPRFNLWLFTGGYIVVWTLFSACATILQTALQNATLVSAEMR